jgi:hypothetical protein
VGKRRNGIFDEILDRFEDVDRDVRKAARRTLGSKKRKKSSSRKWAKRNARELEALTEQVALLVRQLSQQSKVSPNTTPAE